MSRRIIAGVAAAGIAILASCSQDKSPSALVPTEASYLKGTPPPPPPTCSFSTATQDAKNYFTLTTGSTKDPVFTSLSAMQSAGAGTAGATSAGFDVLRRIGAAVSTTAVKGTPAQGSVLVNDVLLCMIVSGYGDIKPVDFSTALAPGGLFAVRTSASTDNAAVVARSGRYGAEPTGATWPVVGPTLFYGFPVSTGDTFGNDPRVGTVFDLKTLPTQTFTADVRVGVCDLSGPGRILHVHGAAAAVLATDLPTFCPTTFNDLVLNAPSSMFTVAAHQLASWLSPKPAYAARMMLVLKGGGTIRGLSEIGPIAPLDTIVLDRIPNGSVSHTTGQFQPVVTAHVLTKAGKHPIGGVTVNLVVTGNKGSFIATGGTATTVADGSVTFPAFYIDKAGGYTVSAQAPDDFGANSFTAVSNLFNINGQ